jgi:hypothetical protein
MRICQFPNKKFNLKREKKELSQVEEGCHTRKLCHETMITI